MRSPLARKLAVAALTSALVLSGPAVALGWSNGEDGYDSFGTHDWILYEANRLAQSKGYTWLDWTTALPRTDDPDSVYRDFTHHSYDVWGPETRGDSPAKVGSLYSSAVYQLRSGNRTAASGQFGLLAHYFADTYNPMHTDDSDRETSAVHNSYERGAQNYTHFAGQNRGWISFDGIQRVWSPYAETVSGATFAHGYYTTLVDQFASSGYTPGVSSISQRVLARSTNDLADLIASAEMATKAKPAGLSMWRSATYPKQYSDVTVFAKVTDASGVAIPGLRVTFTWRFKTVTRTQTAVTDYRGVAACTRNIAGATKGYKVVVTATASANGVTRTSSTWFVPQ